MRDQTEGNIGEGAGRRKHRPHMRQSERFAAYGARHYYTYSDCEPESLHEKTTACLFHFFEYECRHFSQQPCSFGPALGSGPRSCGTTASIRSCATRHGIPRIAWRSSDG